jgi:FkbM family methyltransferase
MSTLPEDAVARFYAGYRTARKMDYDKHDIYLLYTSPLIQLRLRSCEKEPFTVDWVEQFVKPGHVFYDVGANVGAYSLIAAKHTGGKAKIFAFEPSFPTFRDLCQNVILNGCEDSITPLPIALWSGKGLKTFHYATLDAGAAKHGLHLGADSSSSVYRERVLTLRLDHLKTVLRLPRPHHIKIDVDGPEFEVLRGADETLSHPKLRSIIVEIRRKAGPDLMATKVGQLLGSKGFRLQSQHRREGKVRAPNYGVFVRDEAGKG